MDIQAYLKRIKASENINLDLESLRKLQQAHLFHVPFENLDVMRREPIYLNIEHMYKKIVESNRGGYCYEVNGLFHWALSALGFNASLGSATVRRPQGYWAKEDTHMIIFVKIENAIYLTDVGFGDSNYHSIPLDGSEQADASGTYKVIEADETWYHLTRQNEEDWTPLYRFQLKEKRLIDFHEGIVFNQVSPGSSFTHHDLVTKATPTGRITLRDQTLITKENGIIEKADLTDKEKAQVLLNTFNIQI